MKTLTKKKIKGKYYYYLAYRKKGVLVNDYLGPVHSKGFKKYLLKLTKEEEDRLLVKAKIKNHSFGVPLVYVEDKHIVYEYKNGIKEILNKKMEVIKVEQIDG